MENPQLETLIMSENPPFQFLNCRRTRPLKSKSFDTFLRIVTECHLHLQNQEQVATVQGDRLVEKNDLGTEDGLARENSLVNGGREGDILMENKDSRPEDVLACDKSLVNEDLGGDKLIEDNDLRAEDELAREKSLVDENRKVVSSQVPGFSRDHMDVDGLDFVDNVKSKGDQGPVDNIDRIEPVVEGNQHCNNDFAAFASLLDNDDQFNLPDFDLEEFDLGEQLGDKAPCADVDELIDSLLETDATVGASMPIANKDENNLHVKRNEIETQMDVRESDTPVSSSVMISSSHQKTVEGIEDGEISEVSGVLEKSSDLLHEDVAPLENSVDKGDLSGDIIQKEGFSPNALQSGLEKDNQYFGQAKNEVNITSTAINVKMGNDNHNLVNNRTQVYYGDTVEDDREERKDSRPEFGRNRQRCAPKEAHGQASCPKNISLSGGSTGENTIENQCSASTEKVANQNNNKRKRVRSEEVKDKNKKKKRMKRAKKNRELGVKRLKLQPVTKPKTVKYCDHFLKGRCHEGEKCRFSHDTIPLTKSKPCCHFVRQSCMKGDDCPFDHQLSKYPCNNFLIQGSCTRGSNCMFSHKVLVKEGSNICNPDLRPVSAKENSFLKKQMNPNSTGTQNASTEVCSSGVSYCKNDKKNGDTAPKPPGQAPKGISFLSHGKLPVSNMSKHGQGASDGVEGLNKNTQRTPVVPRGVNFLSFGGAPSESFSTKKSSFSLVSNVESGKSPPSDFNKSERAGSSSKTDVVGKVDSQTGQGASSIAPNKNETANRTPAMTPQGLGFLSVGNLLDSSSNKKQAGSNLNEINAMRPTIRNTETLSDKLRTPNPVLPPVMSSPPSRNHSVGKLLDVQSKGPLSSFQGSLFSNTPSSVQRAFQSTLALAAKFESKAKNGHSYDSPAVSTDLSKEGSSSQNKSLKPSTILDFLYSAKSKTKQ